MCYAFVKITENHFSSFLLAGMKRYLYLCTRQTKGRAPAFGLTRTFDFVRGATHVVTRQTKGRARCYARSHSEINETTRSKDKTRFALKISHRLKSKADAYRQKVLYYFVVNP